MKQKTQQSLTFYCLILKVQRRNIKLLLKGLIINGSLIKTFSMWTLFLIPRLLMLQGNSGIIKISYVYTLYLNKHTAKV